MEIVQEHKALDDYQFFVELGRDEIEGGCTRNSQEKMKVIMCYWKMNAQPLSTFIFIQVQNSLWLCMIIGRKVVLQGFISFSLVPYNISKLL